MALTMGRLVSAQTPVLALRLPLGGRRTAKAGGKVLELRSLLPPRSMMCVPVLLGSLNGHPEPVDSGGLVPEGSAKTNLARPNLDRETPSQSAKKVRLACLTARSGLEHGGSTNEGSWIDFPSSLT